MSNPKIYEQFGKKNEDFVEKCDPKPDSSVIPGQAVKLSELLQRFERGQRLNIHLNPGNEWFPEDQVEAKSEHFEDAAPEDIQDIVDVENFHNSVQEHKRDFQERMKNKKAKAKEKEAPKEAPADKADA